MSEGVTLELSAERLRSLLSYDPDTGVFRWNERPVRPGKERTDKTWNAKWSGKVAGCLRPDGYWTIGIDDCSHLAHRLAWFYVHGAWPEVEIDHEDRCRTNNRIKNLREATGTQNQGNRGLNRNSTSGAKGVYWSKKTRKWIAQISSKGDCNYLGSFDDVGAASAAYHKAAKSKFGEFAHA